MGRNVRLVRAVSIFLSNYIQLSLRADLTNYCMQTAVSRRELRGWELCCAPAAPSCSRLLSAVEQARTERQPPRNLCHKSSHRIPAAALPSLLAAAPSGAGKQHTSRRSFQRTLCLFPTRAPPKPGGNTLRFPSEQPQQSSQLAQGLAVKSPSAPADSNHPECAREHKAQLCLQLQSLQLLGRCGATSQPGASKAHSYLLQAALEAAQCLP